MPDLELLEWPAVPEIGPHAVLFQLAELLGDVVGRQVDSLSPNAAALQLVGR